MVLASREPLEQHVVLLVLLKLRVTRHLTLVHLLQAELQIHITLVILVQHHLLMPIVHMRFLNMTSHASRQHSTDSSYQKNRLFSFLFHIIMKGYILLPKSTCQQIFLSNQVLHMRAKIFKLYTQGIVFTAISLLFFPCLSNCYTALALKFAGFE